MQQFLNVFDNNIFLAAAGILILGFIFSRLVKYIKLPRVSGYIITGIIFGPSIIKLFSEQALHQFDFFPKFALGIIALVIGAQLSFKLIKRLGFRLILLTLFESFGAFFLVTFLLSLFKMPLAAVLPLAAIAAATAPAATVAVIRECRAQGPLTETTLAVVALDDAIAIILFGLILTLDPNHLTLFGKSTWQALSSSLLEIFVALLLGLAIGVISQLLFKFARERADNLTIIIGVVLLTTGLASFFNTSPLLSNMFLGLVLINLSQKNEHLIVDLEKFTPPIYCFFFVLAGANLNLAVFAQVGPILIFWGIIFVLARLIGKTAGAYIAGTLSKAPDNIKKYLGLTLVPEAGVAIGLSLLIGTSSAYFEFRSVILNVTLMAVAINELIGPICTKYALFKAGEATIED